MRRSKTMNIDIALKIILLKIALLFPFGLEAWTVSERIVELSQESETVAKHIEPETVSDETPAVMKKWSGRKELFKEEALSRQEDNVKKSPDLEKGVFEKTRASFTLEEHVAMEHQRALQFFDKKDFIKGEAILIEILDQTPRHHESRIELANFYLKEERVEAAETILLEGLKLDENHPDFLRLMAMVHDRKGEPDKALAFLVKVKDSRKQDRNYIAFLGHIYQQTGRYSLARQQYFRLLEMEPKNPLWLLGVSIALDAEGQRNAALEGYQRLTAEGNIDPSILKYVQDRIDILKG